MPNKRILVVDDDRSSRALVAAILREERYEVETANGGRDALWKIGLALSSYDAIVLDLMMPDVSGFDVLASLAVTYPRIKCVVVLSGSSCDEMARASTSNVFTALQKPFDGPGLLGAVRGCIDYSGNPTQHAPALGRAA